MKLKEEFITKDAHSRLHGLPKAVIALTGGIATGKSTVSDKLKAMGLPVVCADTLVKSIYATEEAKDFIFHHFPDCIEDERIDFSKLRTEVFNSDLNKKIIENFIYARLPKKFLEAAKKTQLNFIIYDVPLLFEKNLDNLVDYIICVATNKKIQRERLKKRDGNTDELIDKILGSQIDIDEKVKRSNLVIYNDSTLADLEQEVERSIRNLLE